MANKSPGVTEINVKQIQPVTATTGLFRVSTTILIGYNDKSTSSHRITITGKDSTFRLENKKGLPVEYVIFDSGNRLLKKLTFNRSFDQLASAATGAPLAIDRYEAITEMRTIAPKSNAMRF